MDPEKTLGRLFVVLRERLYREHGVRLAMSAEADRVALHVRSHDKATDEHLPRFAIAVTYTRSGYRIRYRPRGHAAPAEQLFQVGYARTAVRTLDELVRKLTNQERGRLMDYRRCT